MADYKSRTRWRRNNFTCLDKFGTGCVRSYIISKQQYLDVVQNLQKAEMDVYHRRTTLFIRSAAETDVAPI